MHVVVGVVRRNRCGVARISARLAGDSENRCVVAHISACLVDSGQKLRQKL